MSMLQGKKIAMAAAAHTVDENVERLTPVNVCKKLQIRGMGALLEN
jgi:hypothetical protein